MDTLSIIRSVYTCTYLDTSNPKMESVCPVQLAVISALRASHSLIAPSRQLVYTRGDNLSHCKLTIPAYTKVIQHLPVSCTGNVVTFFCQFSFINIYVIFMSSMCLTACHVLSKASILKSYLFTC